MSKEPANPDTNVQALKPDQSEGNPPEPDQKGRIKPEKSARDYSIGKLSRYRIGELLVKEGLASQEDIEKALDIQRVEAEEAKLPLGDLLLKKGFISNLQLQSIKEHPDVWKSVGTLAVKNKLITEAQLTEAKQKNKANELIGNTLVREKYIAANDLKGLYKEQQGRIRLIDLARKFNMITDKDYEDALVLKKGQRTIGEILCDLKKITPADLNRVLQKYSKQLKLGEFLVKQGIVSQEKLQLAVNEQRHSREPLGKILVEKKYITTTQLYSAWARQYNMTFKRLDNFDFNEPQKIELSRIVRKKYAEKHMILPLTKDGNALTLGISNPQKIQIVYDLRAVYTQLKIIPVLITEEKFAVLFHSLYGKGVDDVDKTADAASQKKMELVELDLKEVDDKETKVSAYGVVDMEAEQVVDFIIKYGILNGASDIHIEQDRQGVKLRYRMDGILQMAKPKWLNEKIQNMAQSIVSRIKVMSNLDIAERRMPQDGVFRVNYIDKSSNKKFDLDFRVATCPAIVGENVTIRILDSRKANVGLDALNHSRHVLTPLKIMFKSAAGMILVSGPTGSGKSSTLYAALQYIYNPDIKIITAEDPIEYSFPGIMQTQINPKINLTFAKLLRSFLRLDPDVILVGEIRDSETAQISFDAAQTGHLLLSTIHTNDAIASISRLLDLNIEKAQIASSLMGVIAQRLIRKTCDTCIKQHTPFDEEIDILFSQYPEGLKFYQGVGCKECNFSGFNGRTLISELFEVNREIATALSKGAEETEIRKIALEGGMKTMVDDGIMKLNQTTISEIIRVVPHEMMKEYKSRQIRVQQAAEKTAQANEARFGSGGGFVLSNPNVQTDLIDQMFTRYKELAANQTNDDQMLDPFIFKDFVAENYHSICFQYACDKVTFWFEVSDDKVGIYAKPNTDLWI